LAYGRIAASSFILISDQTRLCWRQARSAKPGPPFGQAGTRMDRGGRSAQTLTHETRSIDVIPVATVIFDEMRAAVVEARGGAGAQADPQDRPNQPIRRLVETAGPNGPMYSAHRCSGRAASEQTRSLGSVRQQAAGRNLLFGRVVGRCLPDHRADHAVIAHVPFGSDLPVLAILGLDAACIVPS
jgi:hypothetical protein